MPVIYMERSSINSLTETEIKELIDKYTTVNKYRRLENYYKGKHDILYRTKRDSTAPNNRIVTNMAKYITDTAVGYFIGKPVLYSSRNSAYYAKLQEVFDYNDEQDESAEIAKKCSIDGHCFELLYMDEEAMIRFVKLDPDSCTIVCAPGSDVPLAAWRTIYSRDKDDNSIRKVEYWDKWYCWFFVAVNGGSLQLKSKKEHYWHDVPFVEYVNNAERIGDFEGVISIIDEYNRVQSNTANYFAYNDEAILKVLKLGNVSSQDIAAMKEKGAIILNDGGDIQWLTKEVSDIGLENHKNRLRDDMHSTSNVPNLSDDNFGGNLSGVAISYKLWVLDQLCSIKERKFKRGLQRRIELITNILNIMGGNYDYRDIEIQFRRNKPQNMLELAQIVTMLAPELSRETRLKMLPNVDNVQDEIDKLRQEQQEDLQGFGGSYESLVTALQNAAEEPDTGDAL